MGEDEEGEPSVFGGEEEEQEEMESAASSRSGPFIFLFLAEVMAPSAAVALASWVGGAGGLGEDKLVGNM